MKFTFGTIMGEIAPIRNASKARFPDLLLLRNEDRKQGLPQTSVVSA
jgi:hypothetical protein